MKTINLSFLLLLAAQLSFGQSQECLPDNRTFPENNPLQTVNVFGLTGTFSGDVNNAKSCSETGKERTLSFAPNCTNGTPTITAFLVEGGLDLVSQSGTSITVKPVPSVSSNQPNRYNKGRITADYTCAYDTTVQVPVPCLNDSTTDYTYTVTEEGRSYVDLYQQFPWDAPIVGPVCVTQGERVTYSIFDYVSGTSNTGLGIDDYKWCFPAGWDLAYFSSDHSSVTLDATAINAGADIITVQVGRCNTRDTSKIIGQLLPAPDSATLSQCLDGTGTSLNIPLTPNANITYTWNITADGNGYTYVSGNSNTQGDITINVGSHNAGYVLLTSDAIAGNGVYCDEATRTDTLRYARRNTNPVITGPTCVAPGVSYDFSVDLVAPITWTFPSGYTITSSDPTAASITVVAAVGTADSNVVAVNAGSACGAGTPAYKYVKVGPGKPDLADSTCFNPGSNVTYTLSGNADSYYWTFPSGFSPSSSQGGTSFQPYTGTSAGGNIIVYGIKADCPNSVPDTLAVLPTPGNVSYINSDKSCINKGMPDTLTLTTNCGYGAYEWTFTNPNWSISGTDDACTVTVITDGNSSDATVKAVNACGSGQSFTKAISADGIGQTVTINQYANSAGTGVVLEVSIFGASYQWYQDGTPISGGRLLDLPYADTMNHAYCVAVSYGGCSTMVCDDADYTPNARRAYFPSASEGLSTLKATEELTIAPNPAENFVELGAAENLSGIHFTIVSLDGVERATGIFKSNGNRIDVNKWPNGIYLVKYTINGKSKSHKFQVL